MAKQLRELTSSLRPTRLGAVHWVARKALEARGYRWELRRQGALKLGLLRKNLRKVRPGEMPRRLVVLPGFGDSALSWVPIFTLVQSAVRKAGYDELLFIDFPGFSGFLARARSFHSMNLLRDAVFDLLDAEKPHTVLGHSLGGWLAALYSADCGKGVRPFSPSGKKGEYAGPARDILIVPAGLFASEGEQEEWRKSIAAMFQDWRARIFYREPSWFRLVAEETGSFLQKRDVQEFLRSMNETHSLAGRMADIRSEVWLLWSERDSLLPLPAAQNWLKSLSGEKRGILLKRVGHSPHLENATATASVLARLFAGKMPYQWGSRWWDSLS